MALHVETMLGGWLLKWSDLEAVGMLGDYGLVVKNRPYNISLG